MIKVCNVSKDFKLYKRPAGFFNVLKSAFYRSYEVKNAVKDLNFQIDGGEIVGYVGPNGAGKSTTIKMLSGILTPTQGEIIVSGIVPYRNRIANSKNIGVVFGQRSQLYWDLPVEDSFDLHEKMYEIPPQVFRKNVSLFTEVLDMGSFLCQPVRQLSLGQKMRANIAISLLHDPKIVFLDEPTIGLDIVAKAAIRNFILEVNRTKGTTFLITTHDMSDIEQVCRKLILIDKGRLQYEGELKSFREKFGRKYTVSVTLREPASGFGHPLLEVLGQKENTISFSGDKTKLSIAEAVNYLTHTFEIEDISIQDSDVESILREVYAGECDLNPIPLPDGATPENSSPPRTPGR
ncbi:MAG: ATP-binding cassette domain-containing protein [Clostridium sp.]|jgi:ABC-2 type transport system ATP-binding protein|nr:ATP-binding cassette domain-containing protein [Clostridium sp.]